MKRGDAFVNTNPGSPRHLWIVCLEIDGSILMFNLTSLPEAIDATCVVGVGDHPWVVHDSAIEYGRGRLLDAGQIALLEALGFMEHHEQASEALIDHVLRSALRSPEIAGTQKAIIEAMLNAEEE